MEPRPKRIMKTNIKSIIQNKPAQAIEIDKSKRILGVHVGLLLKWEKQFEVI